MFKDNGSIMEMDAFKKMPLYENIKQYSDDND